MFSRCWPQESNPFVQPLWLLAERLGADCSTQYNISTTTHVIAPGLGTTKVTVALCSDMLRLSECALLALNFEDEAVLVVLIFSVLGLKPIGFG